jgi:hypothetical protein
MLLNSSKYNLWNLTLECIKRTSDSCCDTTKYEIKCSFTHKMGVFFHCKESDAGNLRGGGGELGNLKPYPVASLLLHKVN